MAGCQKKHTLIELAALKENKRKKTEKLHKLHNYTLTKNSKAADVVILSPAHQPVLLVRQSSKLQLGFCQRQPLVDSLDCFTEVFCLFTIRIHTLHYVIIN